MSFVVDMDGLGLDDLDKVFEMMDFLGNSKELLEKFEPDVSKFLAKKDFFHGHFLVEYNKQFDDQVRSLIKTELMQHFQSWTPADLLILTEDIDFLKILANDLFDQEAYRKLKLN